MTDHDARARHGGPDPGHRTDRAGRPGLAGAGDGDGGGAPAWSDARAGTLPTVIGVVGACGGAGASVLASALAAVAARAGARTALVDGARDEGGIDVLLGIEDEPGLRWPDLHSARGEVGGDQLLDLLPRWRGVSILSADRRRPGTLPDDVPRDVASALAAVCDVVVHDVPRGLLRHQDLGGGAVPGPPGCDVWVLAGRLDLASVAGAIAIRALLGEVERGLVLRGRPSGTLTAVDAAAASGVELWGEVGDSRALAGAVERGEGPLVQTRRRRSRGLAATATSVLARACAPARAAPAWTRR